VGFIREVASNGYQSLERELTDGGLDLENCKHWGRSWRVRIQWYEESRRVAGKAGRSSAPLFQLCSEPDPSPCTLR
jgi:hypothetical protein